MKKTIAFLLAAVLCLSLAGTAFAAGEAGQEQITVTADDWQEYFQLKPEYDGKFDVTDLQAILTARPVPQSDDAVEVPITLDNWSQYFEITEKREEYKDDFGNVRSALIMHFIDVREEFADRVVPGVDSAVRFQVMFDYVDSAAGYDSSSYSDIATATYDPAELERDEFANDLGINCEEEYTPEGELEAAHSAENFTVTQVEGSLFLAGMDPEEPGAADAEAVPTAVAITADNWSEYFEVVGKTVLNSETNVFGEESLKYAEYRYYLLLKDEYRDKLAADGENAVAYEMEYTHGWCYASFDDQTQELTIGAQVPSGTVIRAYGYDTTINQPDSRETKMGSAEVVEIDGEKTIADDISMLFQDEGRTIWEGEFGTDTYCVRVLSDITMLRVEGTITLYM